MIKKIVYFLFVVLFMTIPLAMAENVVSKSNSQFGEWTFTFDPDVKQGSGSMHYTSFLGHPIDIVYSFSTYSMDIPEIVRFIYIDNLNGEPSGLIEFNGNYYWVHLNPIPIER